MTVLHTMRLRVIGVLIGLTLATIGVLSWAALPVLPVLGFAVATAAMMVNSMTSRLAKPLCRGCGLDLSGEPTGQYGVVCTACGRINQLGMPQINDSTDDPALQDESVLAQTDTADQDATDTSDSSDSLA